MTTPTTVNVQFQLRADTAANWTAANPILLANEFALETDTKKLKVGDGSTAWASLAYFPSIVTGGTVLGNLEIASTGTLTFEGSTANDFETTLAVTDPTADRTITLPDQSGTVVVSGNASIVDADIAAGAEIAVSKLANGTANQVLVTDGTDVSWSDDLTLAGNLTVNGTTTTVNTQTLVVEDKNIELGVVGTPTDVTADGGGITLKGTTDKTINWIDATDSWTSSENIDLASGKSYRINDTEVLSATTLGSGVTSSSLTSVGTITAGTWQGTAIDATYLDSTVVTTGDTGTITSTMIADGAIVDADVSGTAAIAGSKIDPDFGSQTVETTGVFSAAAGSNSAPSITFTGDLNTGIYSPGADQLALSTNGTQRVQFGTGEVVFNDDGNNYDFRIEGDTVSNLFFVDASAGLVGIGTSAPSANLDVTGTTATIRAGSSLNTDGAFVRVCENQFQGGYFKYDGSTNLIHIGSHSAADADTGNDANRITIVRDTGNVGIGTTSPGANLEVAGSAFANIFLTDTTASATGAIYGDGGSVDIRANNSTNNRLLVAAGRLSFDVNGSERARIDSSGRLLVGTSSAPTASPASSALLTISDNTTKQNIGYLNLQNTATILNNYSLGSILFSGHGANGYPGAQITGAADANWSSTSYPGRLVFSTTADGASSPTERMRIKSNGTINFSNVAVYADNAAATTGGLAVGDVYRTSTGQLMIRY